jgi:hypothetical protein
MKVLSVRVLQAWRTFFRDRAVIVLSRLPVFGSVVALGACHPLQKALAECHVFRAAHSGVALLSGGRG